MGIAGTPRAKKAVVAERRARAIELRLAGVDLVSVGRQLHYGKWEKDGSTDGDDGKPDFGEQITSDVTLAALVSKDVGRGLADRRRHLDTSAGEYVTQSTERLERLRAAAWGKAMLGSVAHVRECVRIEAQLAQLHGWNKPIKHSLDLPGAQAAVDQAVAELVGLVDETGATVTTLPAREG